MCIGTQRNNAFHDVVDSTAQSFKFLIIFIEPDVARAGRYVICFIRTQRNSFFREIVDSTAQTLKLLIIFIEQLLTCVIKKSLETCGE